AVTAREDDLDVVTIEPVGMLLLDQRPVDGAEHEPGRVGGQRRYGRRGTLVRDAIRCADRVDGTSHGRADGAHRTRQRRPGRKCHHATPMSAIAVAISTEAPRMSPVTPPTRRRACAVNAAVAASAASTATGPCHGRCGTARMASAPTSAD